MRIVKIFSNKILLENERELIVGYVDSEGDNIILLDVLETRKSLELIVEAKKESVENLMSIFNHDFNYRIKMLQIN